MSTRKRLSSIYRHKLKKQFANLEESWGLLPQHEYFPDWENRPLPQFTDQSFDANEAWWMAQLCLLSYTPDSKEFRRVWNASKPDRLDILEERSPFQELLDVHRLSNHASIFEITSGGGGTVLCFRGTIKAAQWISNLVFHRHEWSRFRESDELAGAMVHSGFYVVFKRLWPLLWPTLRLSPRPWIFTGHSLGGALAQLANAVAKADKVYTFGAPRIGNQKFADSYLDNVIRVVNDQDIVPLLPSRGSEENVKIFDHGGELIWLAAEEGLLNEEASLHITKQPWVPLDEWSKQSEAIFQQTPPWLRDHFISQYCEKVAGLLP